MASSDKSGLVVAANRLSVAWDDQTEQREASPGGLVSALTPILQEAEGAWVGWTGRADHAPESFVHEGIRQCWDCDVFEWAEDCVGAIERAAPRAAR